MNLFPENFAAAWAAQKENAGAVELFGEHLAKGSQVEGLVKAMDDGGVDVGVLTSGLRDPTRAHHKGMYAAEDFFAICDAHPGRFLVSAAVDSGVRPMISPTAG